MIKEEDLRKAGIFAKPHGVKGEISLITDDELSDIAGDPYIVCNIDDIYVPFFVESFRQKSASNTLVKFENIDSADKVRFMTGKTAFVPTDLFPLPDNRPLHQSEMIGFTLIDDNIGTLGTVIDVDDSTPNILLKVDYKGSDLLVPLALVTSNQQYQMMKTSLPDGFLELYTETHEKVT